MENRTRHGRRGLYLTSILHDSRELSSENVMPQQPRTAFFTPSKNITAKSVFEALANAEIDAAEIACLQR